MRPEICLCGNISLSFNLMGRILLQRLCGRTYVINSIWKSVYSKNQHPYMTNNSKSFCFIQIRQIYILIDI